MELEKKCIHKNQLIATAFAQATIEDDYNLPDYKLDIMRVIKVRGRVQIDETKVGNQSVFLQGKLIFEVLYRGEGIDGCISSLKGEIPYREKINVNGVDEHDPVNALPKSVDVSVSVINSRKLSVRGLVDFEVTAKRLMDVEVPCAMENEEQYEVQKANRRMLQLLECKKDIIRLRQEVTLPEEKPNAVELLWDSVCIQQMNHHLNGEGVEISAVADVCILYKSGQETPFEWYETSVPISGTMECSLCGRAEYFQVKVLGVQPAVELREDYDGEMRSISVDITMEIELSLWQEDEVTCIEDAYSLSQELQITKEAATLEHIYLQNYGRCKVAGEMALEDLTDAMYLCSATGEVVVEDMEIVDEGVEISGKLVAELLYLTTDDEFPISCSRGEFPFVQVLEVKGITGECRLDLQCGLETLQASFNDHRSAAVRAELQLNLLVFRGAQMDVITEISQKPYDYMKLQESPGMIGYVVGEGDCLWKIAKENHTTRQALMDTNHLEEDRLSPGQKLLIVKSILA